MNVRRAPDVREALAVRNVPRRILQFAIRVYQWTLSPFIGNQCRFYPSCSHYAFEALEEHGAVRGTLLAARRLGRCHPFHPGGVDPVPTREES
ncbi:MAG: membrane protein insertion efficiency factor YidD [Gammaproteobacteria bacterium]|nr:membrane protein insertion efficiency factor YidD [Gammaproteobacteria bacterium]